MRSWRPCKGGGNIGGGQIVVGVIDRLGEGGSERTLCVCMGRGSKGNEFRVGRFIGIDTSIVEYLYLYYSLV